jgi:hypothetical protein
VEGANTDKVSLGRGYSQFVYPWVTRYTNEDGNLKVTDKDREAGGKTTAVAYMLGQIPAGLTVRKGSYW